MIHLRVARVCEWKRPLVAKVETIFGDILQEFSHYRFFDSFVGNHLSSSQLCNGELTPIPSPNALHGAVLERFEILQVPANSDSTREPIEHVDSALCQNAQRSKIDLKPFRIDEG